MNTPFWIVFVAMALESTLVVGFLVPGIGIAIAATVAVSVSDNCAADLAWVAVAMWSGTFAGDTAGFLVGRLAGSKWKLIERCTAPVRVRVMQLLTDHPRRLWFYQLPVVTRSTVPVVFGAAGLTVRTWIAIEIAATTVFTAVIVTVGYGIGSALGPAAARSIATAIQIVAGGVVVIAILRPILIRHRRRGHLT